MEMLELECFGGPMDGQKMPIPDEADEACGVCVDKETGEPHFYATVTRWNMDGWGCRVLEYLGSNPYVVIAKLRDRDSPLADEIEEELHNGEQEFDADDD